MGGKRILIAIFMILVASGLKAQNHWNAEIRPGLNFPSGNISGVELNLGYGADASISYEFLRNLSTYAGWGWNSFRSDDSEFIFEEAGYSFGLLFIHPIRKLPLSYVLSGGMLYKNIEVENRAGENLTDTDPQPGWQLTAGIDIALGNFISLRPTFRYNSLLTKPKTEFLRNDLHLKYVSFGIGVSKTF